MLWKPPDYKECGVSWRRYRSRFYCLEYETDVFQSPWRHWNHSPNKIFLLDLYSVQAKTNNSPSGGLVSHIVWDVFPNTLSELCVRLILSQWLLLEMTRLDCLVALFRINRAPPKKSGKMQRPSLQHYRRGGVGWEVWTGQEVTFIVYLCRYFARYFVGNIFITFWDSWRK